jgi:hypothetical protein
MATVILNWNRKSVPEKLLKAQYIIEQMTVNATDFPNPNPTLLDVEQARADLSKKAVAAQAGGYALTFAKNEAEKVLDGKMKSLQAYVQNISGGVEAVIIRSGMEVKKTPSPLPDPTQVQNLDAFPTRTQGEVQLTWDTMDNVIGFQVERWSEDKDGTGFWDKIAITTKSKLLAKGLNTGTVYRFRVAGIGKDDTIGSFSQEASSVAP